MGMRAVSPLIATILLVALTVAIGAMVIGWGKKYAELQTQKCLGIAGSIKILGGKMDTTTNKITLTILYQGMTDMSIPAGRSPLIFIAEFADGTIMVCEVSDTAPTQNECRIAPVTGDKLEPATKYNIDIEFGTGVNLNDFVAGRFYHTVCEADLSITITKYELA